GPEAGVSPCKDCIRKRDSSLDREAGLRHGSQDRSLMRKLLLAIAVALALPGVARAGLVTMVARDVPLGPRGLASAAVPARFDMLGVPRRGAGTVSSRVRSTSGRWSPWRPVDDDSGPALRSPERHPGWRDGALDWVGASDGVRFRTAGPVIRLRAY